MNAFLLDASALVKRYAAEAGTALLDHLFAHCTRDRLSCLMLGAAEVAATLVRKRNGSALVVAALLRLVGGDLVLVASDQRLLRAAQGEGVRTFDPETQDQAALDILLVP